MSWRGFLRRRYWDKERMQEMEAHLAHEIEDNVGRGLNEEEARRRAYVKFGSPQKIRERIWQMNSFGWIESIFRDIRHAGRALRRNPGYALLAVATLGLGIGANTAIFTVINGVLLRPLPYVDQGRIVHIDQVERRTGTDGLEFSVPEYFDYRDQSKSFEQISEYHSMLFTLLGTKNPERVVTGVVSANFFDMLGVKPVLGRLFVGADDAKDASPVLVLTYAYWMKEFGGDRNIVGRVFQMNDRTHTVIGVLPPLPDYPDGNQVYMPVSSCPFRMSPEMTQDRDMRMVSGYARLKPGVTLEQASADVNTIRARMIAAYPKSYAGWTGFAATVTTVKEELTHAARPTFLALLAASGLVLLLACANLANLALSRQVRRSKEVAIRMATGASTWRIVRQLTTEAIVVALAGACVGLAIAGVSAKLLVAYAARMTPLAQGIRLDGWVMLFGVSSSVVAGVLFAALPGLLASHTRLSALREAGDRAAGSQQGTGVRNLLVAAQVAFSFVLLVAAGLMLHSLYNLLSVDPGYKLSHVLSMRINLNWTKYKSEDALSNFYHQLLSRTQILPGVEGAAITWKPPLDPSGGLNGHVLIDGQVASPTTPGVAVSFEMTSPDYFRLLGVPLRSGRSFTDADTPKSPPVVVVSQSAARHFWPGQDPIGHRIKPVNGKHWFAVVGVAGDVRQYGLNRSPDELIYAPLEQSEITNGTLMVKTRGNPLTMSREIEAIIHQIDPEQPVTNVHTLDELRSEQLGTPRVTATLLGLFAAVALFITIVGISGTLALSVARRSKEIGIRMALGATKANILRDVLQSGMRPVLVGIGVGAAGALVATRGMAQLIFGLKPNDPPTFAEIGLLFLVAALVSCLGAARRAISVDPVTTLRTE
ncbi:ABC transporter permease [Acidobacteria bacterium AB60]|nr:ABC transporter permease [Acidobacteria bacterium AB60]